MEFIRASQIPMLTINLLYALPQTPLWRRLEQEKRLVDPAGRESNVEYLVPYDQILRQWKRCIAFAYDPDYLYQRFSHQMEHTYVNRIKLPNSPARLNWRNVAKALSIVANLAVRVGIFGSYRSTFWHMARRALKKRDFEGLIHVGLVAHHLIRFAGECDKGDEAAAFYAQRRTVSG